MIPNLARLQMPIARLNLKCIKKWKIIIFLPYFPRKFGKINKKFAIFLFETVPNLFFVFFVFFKKKVYFREIVKNLKKGETMRPNFS